MKARFILALGIGLALFASCSEPNPPVPVKRESPQGFIINASDSTVIQLAPPPVYEMSAPAYAQQGYSNGYSSGFSPIINYGGGGYYPVHGYGYGYGGSGPSMGYNGSQTHIHLQRSGFSNNGISSSGATPRISQPTIVNNVSATTPPQVAKPHKSFNINTASTPYAPKYSAPSNSYRPAVSVPKSSYKSSPSYSRPSYRPSRSSPPRSNSRRK